MAAVTAKSANKKARRICGELFAFVSKTCYNKKLQGKLTSWLSLVVRIKRREVITMFTDIIVSVIEVAINNQFFTAGGIFIVGVVAVVITLFSNLK